MGYCGWSDVTPQIALMAVDVTGKRNHWHRRQGSITQYVDCSVDRCKMPQADELLRRRDGSVLAQHTILKADHFYRGTIVSLIIPPLIFLLGMADEPCIRLLGAPNFRKTDLNIYGVAQPNLSGLYTLLTLLGCGPHNPENRSCTWFNTREEPFIFINDEPFVLRDHSNPSVNIKAYAGINRERLDMMEGRLKQDILAEAMQNGGIIMVHDELEDGQVVPCFVGCERVQTSNELFTELQAAGYRVDYHRVPMSHGLSPVDPFIDEYINVFRTVPVAHSVVFSCGLGIGRTTFGMLVGLLIRRALTLKESGEEPFKRLDSHMDSSQHDVLRLVLVLEKALSGGGRHSTEQQQSAIQWVLKRDQLIEDLLTALSGNYKVVLDLVRVLEKGVQCKRIVDHAIDRCEDMINLRETILIGRVRHSLQLPDALETALAFLERYFTLISLCGYLSEETGIHFSDWLKARPEIWNMFLGLRRESSKVKAFLPIVRLTGLAQPNTQIPLTKEEQEAAAAETNVLRHRAGSVLVPHTILKIDAWAQEAKLPVEVDGAANLRQAKGENPVWAVAQPRLSAIRSIISRVSESQKLKKIVWICVREEPLVYVHDEPYVLRDKFASLRNLRSYSGITAERLELLETRLCEDILAEAALYNSQVLLHAEDGDGNVCPVWDQINGPEDVRTMVQIFQALSQDFPGLHYHRIPVTAEDAPEPGDFDGILRIVSEIGIKNGVTDTGLIFNCQIGAGRSTMGQVIAALVLAWLKNELVKGPSASEAVSTDMVHFKAVHSILRVIRHGLECKHALDSIIESADALVNLRLAPEVWAARAQHASDPIEARKAHRKGTQALRRYCLLLLFQAYLNDNPPLLMAQDDGQQHPVPAAETFTAYLDRHPEFVKLLAELESGHASLETLQPDQLGVGAAEGHALTNELAVVIGNRQGSVLGPLTILKYDHFPGCQKLSLPERIEGAPNFRQVSLKAGAESTEGSCLFIYGMAMPMAPAIKDVLARVNAVADGPRHLLWVSLREEPVIFVAGRPFVLRVVKDPVTNIEMTGIVSERVESMEDRLKRDVLAELSQFDKKVLLHEEEMTQSGFELVPVWEHADETDIATPAEVYTSIGAEGFQLSYVRIPMYNNITLSFH